MKILVLLYLTSLILLINAQGSYKIHSPSDSSCDSETKLERVNIQIINESANLNVSLKFKMILIDENKNEYPAECIINNNTNSYCLFTPPKNNTNLYYKNDSLNISEGSDIITIEDDFYVIAQKCEDLGINGKANNTEVIYKIFSHSGSWCDYETKLGKVNLQVKKTNNPKNESVSIQMILIDGDKNEYPAECVINNNTNSYCLFTPPKTDTNLYYKNDSLNISECSDLVTFEDDFYVIAQKCEGSGNIRKFNNTEAIYILFSHSGSWCDYQTKLGRVNPQVHKMNNSKAESVTIKMTLIDESENEYPAECIINNNTNSYCLFTPPETNTNLYYKNDSLNISKGSDMVAIEDDFYVIAQKCEGSGNIGKFNNSEVIYKIFSHSGGWCDYETKLGKVNLQVQMNNHKNESVSIQMILIDGDKNEYPAECVINNNTNSYCLFTPPKTNTNLYYKKDSLNISEGSDIVTIEDDFYVIAQKCDDSESISNKTSLIFRQINEFVFSNISSEITFKIFVLTSEFIPKGKEITLLLYLILKGGIVESNLSKAICILDEEVSPKDGKVQADFNCKITGLKNEYMSLIMNNSDDIGDIPKEETLLNPIKTAEAIEKGDLIDYSKLENKNKTITLFIPEGINGTMCPEEGKFKIIGSLDLDIDKRIEFILPLVSPKNYTSNCSIDKSSTGKGEINCIIEDELIEQPLIFDQKIIRDGLKELFILEKFKSEEVMNCSVGNRTDDNELPDNKEDIEIIDKAIERTKITITFRQIRQFIYKPGEISFLFFALVTKKLTAGEKIKLFVNLIKANGEREDKPTEVICTLVNNITLDNELSEQGDFNCFKANLTEEYYSLRLNNSESITGIPKDETLLDPILTDKAIRNKKVIDFSIKENKEKIPAIFIYKKIDEQNCLANGTFIIEGNLSKKIEVNTNFNIPLSYPEGASLKCNFGQNEYDLNKIYCKIDQEIKNTKLITEQIIIKEGNEEILNLGSFSSEKGISCINGILSEAEKKIKIPIAFRQVCHLKNNGINGFSFLFVPLISQPIQVDSIKMKIIVIIDGKKTEKDAICKLENKPKEGQLIKGNFKCEVTLEQYEYSKIDFKNMESIKISPENEEISGISELEEFQISPLATDIAINETKNGNRTDLGQCIDYSIEENQNIAPPSFEIISIRDPTILKENGKLRIIGKFSEDISDKMEFEIPLTYPSVKLKCKVIKAKANEEIEIICKTQKELKHIKNFIFEQRMIKKRFKEMVFVKNKTLSLGNPISCDNYNNLKYERIKKRQKLNIAFLQLSKFTPQGRKANFFLALVKNHKKEFEKLNLKAIIRLLKLSNLRILQEETLVELPITCDIIVTSDTAGGFNCLSDDAGDAGTPINLQLKTDDSNIAGIPDDVEPSELNLGKDYSNIDNLKSIDKLPNITIMSIDGSNCEKNGEYIIKGNLDNGTIEDASNVEIPFGYPDSSGLCDIKVNNKEITMTCQNKEKFDYSNVLFEPTVVQDSEGLDIFKLNSYTNIESLACEISLNSVPIKKNSTDIIDYYNSPIRKKSSGGLSAGTICAIIIPLVTILIIIGAIIGFIKNDKSQIHSSIQSIDSKQEINPK